jgi:hypothetical protein
VLFRLQVTAGSMLCTAESKPIASASRRPVAFTELLDLNAELERQAGRLPPGTPFRVKITDD